jgi:hypothetical protein
MSREHQLLELLRANRKLDELEGTLLGGGGNGPGPAPLLTSLGFGLLRNTLLAGCFVSLTSERRRTPWWLRILLWLLSFGLVNFVATLLWFVR